MVIGIIAILISILLPGLSRARIAAQRVACMSNMRQAAMEVRMYANDYRDKVPLGYLGSNKTWSNSLWYPYTYPAKDAAGKGGTSVLLGLLYQAGYMKSPLVWYCPSELTPGMMYNHPALPPDWWNTSNMWPPDKNTTNQTRSAYFCRPVAWWPQPDPTRPNYVPNKDLSTFAKLRDRAILSEGYDILTLRHKGGQNAAFADGSAAWVPYEAYRANLLAYRANTGFVAGYYILNVPNQYQGGHSNPNLPESGVWVDYEIGR